MVKSFRNALSAIAICLIVPAKAQAQTGAYSFTYSGSGVSGTAFLTYGPDPNTGTIGTSPNAHDAAGSSVITSVTGTFTDSNIGIVDAAITGDVAASPGAPSTTNLLAPHSFGFYPIASGVQTPDGTAPGLAYDNLFYAGGSPQTASDYPFHGGFLDIYGLVFTIAGGKAVNFWSAGDMGTGVTYGVAVTDGTTLLDYTQHPVLTAAVPELSSWAMMITGFAVAGAMLRRRRAVTPEATYA